ncbi:hypothetical protein HBB16_15415 [Pseudonocardia sp. MCCB 268]|nr:hypothetical protein [Pseudonocardia cytotoxica]
MLVPLLIIRAELPLLTGSVARQQLRTVRALRRRVGPIRLDPARRRPVPRGLVGGVRVRDLDLLHRRVPRPGGTPCAPSWPRAWPAW